MKRIQKNNFSIYEHIVLHDYVTLQDLYYLHYSDKEIDFLIKTNILVFKNNKYYIGSIPELYYYFESLLNKRENILARKFYNKLMELCPTYKANYYELMDIALRYGDNYTAYEYCKKLDDRKDYLYDNNLYLYLFSMIIKMSKDDIKYVKELTFEDICVKENDFRFDNIDIENSIREDIYKHKFGRAIARINEKAYSKNKFQAQDVMLKILCDRANSKKLQLECNIKDKIVNDDFESVSKLLLNIEKERKLTKLESTIKYLLYIYNSIIMGNNPIKIEEKADSIFSAIKNNDFEQALSLCYKYKKDHNIEEDNALILLLSKIVYKIKLSPQHNYEESDKYIKIYKKIFPKINNVLNDQNVEIIHLDEENKEIFLSIISTFKNIKCFYYDNNVLLTYIELNKEENEKELIKKANIAYDNEEYMLAIKFYKKLLSLIEEPNIEYYMKIAKSYNYLENENESKKYLKAVNLIINNSKTEDEKRNPQYIKK